MQAAASKQALRGRKIAAAIGQRGAQQPGGHPHSGPQGASRASRRKVWAPEVRAWKTVGQRLSAAAPEFRGQPQLEQPARVVHVQSTRDQQRLLSLQTASHWLAVPGKPVPRGTPDVRDFQTPVEERQRLASAQALNVCGVPLVSRCAWMPGHLGQKYPPGVPNLRASISDEGATLIAPLRARASTANGCCSSLEAPWRQGACAPLL